MCACAHLLRKIGAEYVGGTRDMLPRPPYNTGSQTQEGPADYQFPQRQVMPQATTTRTGSSTDVGTSPLPRPKRSHMRIVAAVIVVGLAVALYFVWSSPTTAPTSPTITQQNISTTSFTTNATTTTTNSSTGSSPIDRGS